MMLRVAHVFGVLPGIHPLRVNPLSAQKPIQGEVKPFH
jgi:hypothetical protein